MTDSFSWESVSASLGTASASIDLNTKPAEASLNSLLAVAERIAGGVEKVGQGADRMAAQIGKGLASASKQTQAFEQEISRAAVAITTLQKRIEGVAWGKFLAGGLGAAKTVASIDTYFKVLLGSEKEATDQLEALRNLAERTNQPFLTIAQSAQSLIPIIRGTSLELDKVTSLAQRLAISDPAQGTSGAIFGIREFLSGEYLSLARRFEIPRNELQKILEAADGDAELMIDGLSRLIDKLGFTEKNVAAIGASGLNSLELLGDAVKELAAEAFMPLLQDVVIPLTQEITKFVKQLKEIDPALLAAVGGLVAGGALAKVAGNWGLGGIGKVAAGATVVGAGAQLGVLGTRALAAGGVGGFEDFKGKSQEDVGAILGDRLKELVGIIATGIAGLATAFGVGAIAIKTVIDVLGNAIKIGGLAVSEAFLRLLSEFNRVRAEILGTLGNKDESWNALQLYSEQAQQADVIRGERLRAQDWVAGAGDRATAEIESFVNNTRDILKSILEGLAGSMSETAEEVEQSSASLGDSFTAIATAMSNLNDFFGTQPLKPFTDKQIDAYIDFQDDLTAIDEKYAQKRTEASADLAADLLAINGKYAVDIKSLQERAAKADDDAKTKLDRQIKDMGRDRGRWEVKARAELQEALERDEIAYQTRIKDRQARFNREKEELESRHRLAIAEAASNLDAVAVQREQDRYAVDKANLEARNQEETTLEEQRHQKLVQQRTADLEAEIAERRAADQVKIADLRAEAKLEQDLRAKDLEEKLAAAEVEREANLAQRKTEFEEKKQQLLIQQQQERAQRESKFVEELNDLAGHEGRKIEIARMGQAQAELELSQWWDRVAARFAASPTGTAPRDTGTPIPGRTGPFHSGTPNVPYTGYFELAGGEGVIRPDVNAFFRRALGGDYTQEQLAGAVAGGGRGAMGGDSYNWSGDLVLPGGAGGRSDGELLALVEAGVAAGFNKAADIRRAGRMH